MNYYYQSQVTHSQVSGSQTVSSECTEQTHDNQEYSFSDQNMGLSNQYSPQTSQSPSPSPSPSSQMYSQQYNIYGARYQSNITNKYQHINEYTYNAQKLDPIPPSSPNTTLPTPTSAINPLPLNDHQLTKHQFTTTNSLYQLQSLIHRLTIQKQKILIASTSTINQNNKIINNYREIIEELKSTIKNKEKNIQGLNMLVENSRQKYERIQKERDELERLLDSVPMTQVNGRLSVNLLILQYEKNKLEIGSLKDQLEKQGKECRNLQGKFLEANVLNKKLKEQLEKLSVQLREFGQKQKIQYDKQTKNIINSYQNIITNNETSSKRHTQKIQKLEQQITHLQKLLFDNRTTINNLQKITLQYQLLKQQQNTHKNQCQVHKNKYQQIYKLYNDKCEEFQKVMAECLFKDSQIGCYKATIQRYVEEIGLLKKEVQGNRDVQKRIDGYIQKLDHVYKNMNNSNSENTEGMPRKITDNQLQTLQSLILQSQTTKTHHQHQLSQHKKRHTQLQQKYEILQKQHKQLKNRLNIQQQSLTKLQQNNQRLLLKIGSLQSMNSQLKMQVQKYTTLVGQYEIKLKISQIKDRGKSISPTKNGNSSNMLTISATNYQNLMQNLTVSTAQKTSLIKQRIQLKLQIQQIQNQLLHKTKHLNTQSFQIKQLQRQKQRLITEKQQLLQKNMKLQTKIERVRREYEEDRRNMGEKMEGIRGTLERVKKQRLIYEESQENRRGVLRNRRVYERVVEISFNELDRLDRMRVMGIGGYVSNQSSYNNNNNNNSITATIRNNNRSNLISNQNINEHEQCIYIQNQYQVQNQSQQHQHQQYQYLIENQQNNTNTQQQQHDQYQYQYQIQDNIRHHCLTTNNTTYNNNNNNNNNNNIYDKKYNMYNKSKEKPVTADMKINMSKDKKDKDMHGNGNGNGRGQRVREEMEQEREREGKGIGNTSVSVSKKKQNILVYCNSSLSQQQHQYNSNHQYNTINTNTNQKNQSNSYSLSVQSPQLSPIHSPRQQPQVSGQQQHFVQKQRQGRKDNPIMLKNRFINNRRDAGRDGGRERGQREGLMEVERGIGKEKEKNYNRDYIIEKEKERVYKFNSANSSFNNNNNNNSSINHSNSHISNKNITQKTQKQSTQKQQTKPPITINTRINLPQTKTTRHHPETHHAHKSPTPTKSRRQKPQTQRKTHQSLFSQNVKIKERSHSISGYGYRYVKQEKLDQIIQQLKRDNKELAMGVTGVGGVGGVSGAKKGMY